MRVTCTLDPEIPSALLVKPVGQMDAEGAQRVWDDVSPRLNQEVPSLLLDFGQVGFLSSAGISILVQLLTRTKSLRGAMSIFSCNERIRSVLKVLMLEGVLNVGENAEDVRTRLRELGLG